MSVKTEESFKRFQEWKEDLEKRCAEHLYQKFVQNPDKRDEDEKPKETPAVKAVRPSMRSLVFFKGNSKVVIGQEGPVADRWCCWVDDEIKYVAYGATAQTQAINFANAFVAGDTNKFFRELLPPEEDLAIEPGPNGEQIRCIFCGNRFIHRSGCMGIKHSGPQLPPSGTPPPNCSF